MAIDKMTDPTWMCQKPIIQTSANILVTMEELVFICNLIDVKRHDYLNTMATEQRNEANKLGNEANNKRHQKEHEKRGVVRILPNTENKCYKNK